MDRNGRFTYTRRQGQQQQQHSHQQQNSSLSSSSSTTSSHSSSTNNTNNNQHLDNHRNSSTITSTTATSTSLSPQQQYSANYTSTSSSSPLSSQTAMSREPITQHDELIRYIREAWNKVSEADTPVIMRTETDHQLKNFKPFNLEEYWGQRLVQNIHVSRGHQ